MRTVWSALAVAMLVIGVLGCAPTATVVKPGGPSIAAAASEPAAGAKPRIAVMDFSNQTTYDVGNGMRSMLTSALFKTDRFIVVEREMLKDVLVEQKLGTTGVVSPETAAPVGEIEGAQLLIYGTVTDFEPGQKGVKTALGGAEQSHVAIDVRIVDAKTARVLSSTTVEGTATSAVLSTGVLKYVGMSPLVQLEAWNNTPVGSAIRLCIDNAVDYIVTQLE